MGNFNFPTTVNTTGFALDKTLSGELYIQQAAIQLGSTEMEQNVPTLLVAYSDALMQILAKDFILLFKLDL